MMGAVLTHKSYFFRPTLQGSSADCARMADRPVIGYLVSDQYKCGSIHTTSARSTLTALCWWSALDEHQHASRWRTGASPAACIPGP